MNVLFMGTPDFAVPCLKALLDDKYDVSGVVTQPDKPKGRGHKLAPPPVKECAMENNIPVYQPETLRDKALLPVLEELNPDVIIVVAYGKILPEYILNFPKYGCINVHASLLPKYRGAAPIQWVIIDGEKETGVTTMYMEKGLDTGDMIQKAICEIGAEETYGELHDKLSPMGADLLIKTLKAVEDGTVTREKQDDALSNYAPMINKETAQIDWSKPAKEVLNLIRGMNPYPMSYTSYGDETLKIIHAFFGGDRTGKSGSIKLNNKKLEIVCGDNKYIIVDEIQFKGGKRMTVESYLNGHSIDESIILG